MIGSNIKKARINKKVTMTELAKTLNVAENIVKSWEQGISIPDISIILKLAKYLEVSTDDLLFSETSEIILIEGLEESHKKILRDTLFSFLEINERKYKDEQN